GTKVDARRERTAGASWLTRRRRRALAGYLFISPWIVGFLIFVLGPMVASLWLSFNQYNLLSSPSFVGIDHFVTMFTKDPLFWGSVRKTLYFATTLIVVGLAGSLACALLLNANLRGVTFFRAAFFIPSLTPIVAAAILWQWIL